MVLSKSILYRPMQWLGHYNYTVYCKSFEVEKFRGFRGLTGGRKTFPVKVFPTGNFKKMVADIIQEKGGLQSQYSSMNVGFNSYRLPLITFRVSSAMTRATLHVA